LFVVVLLLLPRFSVELDTTRLIFAKRSNCLPHAAAFDASAPYPLRVLPFQRLFVAVFAYLLCFSVELGTARKIFSKRGNQ
jgi:hypothetical protein